jgi:hypothetical protein
MTVFSKQKNNFDLKSSLVMLWVAALFVFNIFAAGMCHASWHGMADLKHFHTHGHRDANKGPSHPGVCIENRETGEHHHHHCPFFDACAKAPRQQVFHSDRVVPLPPGPDMASPRCQAPVPDYFHTPLVYRGPPAFLM